MKLSPKTATLLLIIISLVIGTITMNIGSGYLTLGEHQQQEATVCFDVNQSDGLQKLQIEYLSGKLTKDEYLVRENELFNIG